MIYISRLKATLIALACVLALVYAAPNLASQATRDAWASQYASWLPIKGVSLGLDLRGGSHLLLQVDLAAVIREKMDNLAQSIRQEMRTDNLAVAGLEVAGQQVNVRFQNDADAQAARAKIRALEQGLVVENGDQPSSVRVYFDEATWRQSKAQILSQSIEIVRRRVDESGTRESTIARQGDDRIIIQIPGLDNPARIKELLGRTAKLSFHLVDTGMTPGLASRTLPLQESPGEKIAIKRRAILTGDMLVGAAPSFDQNSQPVVSFRLNSTGAKRFCDVTRENTGQPFAIVLDDVVISAPRINEPICGGSAIISGRFSVQETADLSLLLRAGALPAPLTVIEERTVGPSLGSDSVAAGKLAATIGLVLVALNMIAAYGLLGVFAAVALVLNTMMILAILSFIGATLTLPGIAGIVLTIGMAVDANVLIFERIREELRAGKSVVGALDAGYARAMGTIIDSNLTTLIAALVLFLLGAGPIKGFAITLSIGIITSIFSAVMVTRLMVVTWFHVTRPKVLHV
jgi:preprotein translocase subunit SecD